MIKKKVMNYKKFDGKLDPLRATNCGRCGSNNVIVIKRIMANHANRKKIKRWLVKMYCLDCEYESGHLPHSLFNIEKLPEVTSQEEFQWKCRNRFDNYINYINSIEWKQKTEYWKKLVNYKCQNCKRTNQTLHAHHMSYEHFGSESFSDIRILCTDCHNKIHKNSNSIMAKMDKEKRKSFENKVFGNN